MQDAFFVSEKKGELLVSLRNLVLSIRPDAQEEIKYGGLVFNVDSKLICGIFIRDKHFSLEFSFGVMMSDPDKHLEGKGKFRRHLKIYSLDDIANKNVEYFVRQIFNL